MPQNVTLKLARGGLGVAKRGCPRLEQLGSARANGPTLEWYLKPSIGPAGGSAGGKYGSKALHGNEYESMVSASFFATSGSIRARLHERLEPTGRFETMLPVSTDVTARMLMPMSIWYESFQAKHLLL